MKRCGLTFFPFSPAPAAILPYVLLLWTPRLETGTLGVQVHRTPSHPTISWDSFNHVFGNQVWSPLYTWPHQPLSCPFCPLSLPPNHTPSVFLGSPFPLVPKCPTDWDQGTSFFAINRLILSLAVCLEILSILSTISIPTRSVSESVCREPESLQGEIHAQTTFWQDPLMAESMK